METGSSPEPSVSWLRSRAGTAFLVFLAVALYFLLTEHRAHIIQALPWLRPSSALAASTVPGVTQAAQRLGSLSSFRARAREPDTLTRTAVLLL